MYEELPTDMEQMMADFFENAELIAMHQHRLLELLTEIRELRWRNYEDHEESIDRTA